MRRFLAVLGLVLLATLLPAASALAATTAQVFLTEQDLHAAALRQEPSRSFTRIPVRAATLHVDTAERYQAMLGFGAAMTDSSAMLIAAHTGPYGRSLLMRNLFTSRGIDLDFLRVPVGASDFTATGVPYSYDDQPANRTDPALAGFSIAHDQRYQLPLLRRALALDPGLDVFASEWSPPAWMKANGSLSNTDHRGGLIQSDYGPLAAYWAKFIESYTAAGVPIWGISPQNEPGNPTHYPGMQLSAGEEASLVKELAAVFSQAGIHTRIYSGDTGSGRGVNYVNQVQAAGVAPLLSGGAWHCYGGQQGIAVFHAQYPTVQNLMDECSPGIIPFDAAEAIIDAARNWASSAALWNIALDPDDGPVQSPNAGCGHCVGLVTIPQTGRGAPVYGLSYYQLGQFSRFVQRGAVRVATERWVADTRPGPGAHSYAVTDGIDNVAFLNPDGTLVLVAYNHSAAARAFAVNWQGRRFGYTLPAGATVTFRWRTGRRFAVSPCLNAGVTFSATAATPACQG